MHRVEQGLQGCSIGVLFLFLGRHAAVQGSDQPFDASDLVFEDIETPPGADDGVLDRLKRVLWGVDGVGPIG